MNINYNNKIFTSVSNSQNGEVSKETEFHYYQEGNLIWANYSGGAVLKGHLIGTIDSKSHLNFSYHHLNQDLEIKMGLCTSIPKILQDGRIQLLEKWQWTSGDLSKGESVIEEKI